VLVLLGTLLLLVVVEREETGRGLKRSWTPFDLSDDPWNWVVSKAENELDASKCHRERQSWAS
jgi:hypothetical protein